MLLRCLRLLGWLIVGMLVARQALADGVMLNNVSPKALSRGGANLGFADNGGILYDNPAAMTNIETTQMGDIGLIVPIASMGYSDALNDVHSTDATPLPQASIIRRTEDGMFAYGLGFFVPAGFAETYDMQGPPSLPGQRRFESFGSLVKILPGAAVRVTDRLSIGGTLGVGYSYAKFEAPYILQGPTAPGLPVQLNTHGAGACLVWSAGLQYELSDRTTIGAAYHSPSKFTLHGNADIQSPLLGQSSYNTSMDITWPQTVGVGIRHQLSSFQTLSADAIWYDWGSAFDEFNIRMYDASNPFYPGEVSENFPLNWRGSVAAKFGYEHMLSRGTVLRLGYTYNNNPIPQGTLTPLIQAFFEHAVSVGLGFRRGDWEFDAGYMHYFAPDQHVGASDFLGGQFSNASHEAAIDAVFFGVIRHF